MIDENLLVVVTHAAAGDFQVRCNRHGFVDRKKWVEIVVLENITAHFLRVLAGILVAHFKHALDTLSSVGDENKFINNHSKFAVTQSGEF